MTEGPDWFRHATALALGVWLGWMLRLVTLPSIDVDQLVTALLSCFAMLLCSLLGLVVMLLEDVVALRARFAELPPDTPAGYLTVPGVVTDEQAEQLRDEWHDRTAAHAVYTAWLIEQAEADAEYGRL